MLRAFSISRVVSFLSLAISGRRLIFSIFAIDSTVFAKILVGKRQENKIQIILKPSKACNLSVLFNLTSRARILRYLTGKEC